jgi:hypothetical protein
VIILEVGMFLFDVSVGFFFFFPNELQLYFIEVGLRFGFGDDIYV